MTKTRFILLAFVAVLLGGGVYLYFNLNAIILRTTENIATNALGVNVDIGSIDISLSDKKVTVNGIEIDNPPGYSGANAITAERIMIGLNTASKELIDFSDIEVKGSVVNLEVSQKGMNLLDLKNLANSKEQKESAGSEQIRVIIKRMVIDATTINPRISLIDRDLASIKMPALKFNNIGSGGGSNANEVIVQVLTKYINAIQTEARQSGLLNGVSIPGVDDVEKTLNKAKDAIKGLFE